MSKTFYTFEAARKFSDEMIKQGKKVEWKYKGRKFKVIVK